MSKRVAIIADSTCDLPRSVIAANDITIVPLRVIFGPEVFLDNIEMSSEEFWAKIRTSPHHPKTSQPSPGDFLVAFEKLKASGFESVVAILISSGVSGTYQAAHIAAQSMDGFPIDLVDTKLGSLGCGMIAVEAAKMAAGGAGAAEIAEFARRRAEQAYLFLTVESLEWLQKNGRIGRASALLGSLLALKPLLALDKKDGVIIPVEKIRGRSRVLNRLAELVHERVPVGSRLHVSVLHGDCEADAKPLLDTLSKEYDLVDPVLAPVGPVIGTNVGPGTVGLVFYPD